MSIKNSIKIYFVIFCVVIVLLITTILLYTNQRENDVIDSYNINALRAYTSPLVNDINEEYPNIDETAFNNLLNEFETKALVVDLSSNVLFNNSSLSAVNVVNELYQDHTYTLLNKDLVKVSFPIEQNNTIVGFVIFEVPKDALIENDYIVYIVCIIVELFSILCLMVLIRINYKRTIEIPLSNLEGALFDASNGIYNQLKIEKGLSIKSFTNYNRMLEKIEMIISNQANYSKSRKQLIANISHEIRTPLSYVKMSAEILSKDKNCSIENKKYIDTILSKITSIDAIIEDLFRYSRQDLDKLLVEPKEVYAKDMFDKIFNTIKPKEDAKHITISTFNDIPNVLICADESRLVQVISNMVDNAEKHIQDEGIISLKTEIDENHIVITIEDNGTGIKPKDLPYIFEAFYQGEQNQEVKKKGAGLGLAICEYIIDKHNGEIFVYSEVDKGTKFIIKLPEIL